MKTIVQFLLVGLLLFGFNSFGQYVQVGSKLVGTGAVGGSAQGYSISLSKDGNILAVSGPGDNSNAGAVWVYTFSGGNWSQMGNKIVGTGAINGTSGAYQGFSVSLASDGKTLAIGGYGDNSYSGAAWVFSLSGGNWSQVGNKLGWTGTVTSQAYKGYSVSISADGKTLAVGSDGQGTEVYTFSGGNWSQIGSKLIGTGVIGHSSEGYSVSLSSDGKTMVAGGYSDNSGIGAVWTYTFSGGNWSQLGNKLTGTGLVGTANFGRAVSLSSDGQTLAVAAPWDSSGKGAVLVYTLSGTNWSQMGGKLIGTGATTGTSNLGWSVSLSPDGKALAAGGYYDDLRTGGVWVYTLSGGNWSQVGSKLIGTGAIGKAYQGGSVSLSSQGNVLAIGGYRDNSNQGATWVFNNSGILTEAETPLPKIEPTSIYPNPFTLSLTLQSEAELPYTISNIQGIPVESGFSTSSSIGNQLLPGAYLLNLNGNISKIVKISP